VWLTEGSRERVDSSDEGKEMGLWMVRVANHGGKRCDGRRKCRGGDTATGTRLSEKNRKLIPMTRRDYRCHGVDSVATQLWTPPARVQPTWVFGVAS